jgi:hypothetical protein
LQKGKNFYDESRPEKDEKGTERRKISLSLGKPFMVDIALVRVRKQIPMDPPCGGSLRRRFSKDVAVRFPFA